ncbi:RNA-binding protein 25-like [Exaiptasia diaphana]|uniref:Uncharacterized protein n=1 Tax=Exaiptasia diaphana TaxID=2652724 RepID=A0A913Y467_EXADI|nr:RNA-binding protein 25-like [Exaiptasia diaphana]
MTSFVENMMPCEADELRSAHEQTMEKCLETFKEETRFFSIDSVAPHLQELTGKTDNLLLRWLQTNKQRTEESCKALIKELEKTILDPVLSRLVGPDGSQMDFNELVEAYKLIEQRYKDEGRGDLETKALAFVDMNSRLNDEMTRNWDILKKLKNYDALLAKEKTQKAKMEQEKERAKEEMKRLEKEQRDRQKERDMFYKKQEEDKIRMQEMYTKSLEDQKEQMRNMIEANFEAQKKEREDALAHQKTIMDDYANMVKKNFEQRDQEIKLLREQMSEKEAQAKKDLDNMSRKHQEEKEKYKKEAKKDLEATIKKLNADNKAENETMQNRLKKEMKQEQIDKVKKASFLKRGKFWLSGNPDHLDLK